MTYRTTRADLMHKAERIAQMTNKRLSLQTWSPGDGYSRYRLEGVVDTSGSVYNVSCYLRLHEMAAYLDGMLDVLDAKHEAETRTDDYRYYSLNRAEPLIA